MKYKGKQGNSYLFECNGDELRLIEDSEGRIIYKVNDSVVLISKYLAVSCDEMPYKDIKTAVSMMQILIDEGDV